HGSWTTCAPEQLKLANVDVDVFERQDIAMPREQLLRRIKACTGVLCMLTDRIDSDVLGAAGSSLKVVSTMSVGYNHIDVAACRAKHVAVGITPGMTLSFPVPSCSHAHHVSAGVLDTSTAETALALTLAAKRHVVASVDSAKRGEWGVWQPFQYCGTDVECSTVGIVGLGRIGAKYAAMMRLAFRCRILYTGPRPKPDVAAPLDATFCSMDDLLAASDILFTLPNCTIFPHIGSATIKTRQAMADIAVQNVLAGVLGQPLPHAVDV
ncbi:hypothetical protein DYB37_003741, partial [Aphanomyces astaci]